MAPTREKADLPKGAREIYDRGYADGFAAARSGGAAPRPSTAHSSAVDQVLTALYVSGAAHLRLTPDRDGKVVHYKAAIQTFTWPKHYVYYRANHGEPPHRSLEGLLTKVDAVFAGALKPSPDDWRG